MLLRFYLPAVLSLARLVKADDDGFSNLSACGQNCVNNMRTTIGCVPVTDQCLCSNQNFVYGITDCANESCTSSEASAALSWVDSWCASVTASTSTAAAATTTAAATTEAKASVEAATAALSTSETTSANEAAATTDSQSTTTDPVAAVAATGTSTTDAAATNSASDASSSSGTAAKSTSGATASSASSAASSSTTSGASSSSSSDSTTTSGLTAGAKAGIVVGAAGAAICVVAAVMYLSRKRRRPLPRGTMKISEPLPGSGRIGDDVWEQYHNAPPFSPAYAPPTPRSIRSNMTELDRSARPYEDMVPRMTPTRMV